MNFIECISFLSLSKKLAKINNLRIKKTNFLRQRISGFEKGQQFSYSFLKIHLSSLIFIVFLQKRHKDWIWVLKCYKYVEFQLIIRFYAHINA